jgi:hypothetical protein
MQVGVDQDYSIQPIHYSHRIHASNGLAVNIVTLLKKSTGIPSLNVCMNSSKVLLRLVILQRLQNILKLL